MKDRKMKKTISGIIGNGEYLQPDMVIENNGMMWRFNKKWLNGVVDEILDVLENKIDQAKQEERESILKLLEITKSNDYHNIGIGSLDYHEKCAVDSYIESLKSRIIKLKEL
jgi:hypothetical protein